MIGDDGADWSLIGGLVVLVGVAVLGGVALSNAGPASAAVGVGADDSDWNTTDGSEAVAEDCPPADALRTEVYDGLEDRSVEEVRSVIPDDAVRCLPPDVRNALELENETEGGENGTDRNESADSGDCPPADTIRSGVDAELEDQSKAEIRAELSEDEIACLPADVIDQLDFGTGSAGGKDDSTDGGSEGVECPSDEEMRASVEMALADRTVATVREEIPDDYRDCLPADVKDRLNIDGDGTDASAPADTETGTGAGDASGTETATETEGVDCPPPETLREDVNRTLERMPAAQFRTMVPDEYVECFPPDLKQRLGLTASAGTASADGDAAGATDEQGATGSSAPAGADGRDSFDTGEDGDGIAGPVSNGSAGLVHSDGDGVPDRYDYAPRDSDVQSKGDVQGADDPGSDDGDGGDDADGGGIPVAAGSALLLVLAAGTGATVYRRYGGTGSDDELPQPVDPEPVMADESRAERHDVFGESAFDPGGGTDTQAAFAFDDHGDDDGFVFDNDPDDEDVITIDSDDAVGDEAADAGFVFEGEPSGELDEAGEPADD